MNQRRFKPTSASIGEVSSFLVSVRKALAEGSFVLIDRSKNLEAVARLGITPKEEVRTLVYQDYDRGPLPDHDGNGFVWEFIKDLGDDELYVKLKMDSRGCVCISMHESDGPITLPYKE